jgi:uncharacterized protein (DUF1697 family)
MRTWVALLRGINVGGQKKVSMPALRKALAEAGFEDVRTYLNSGNVLARSAHTKPAQVSAAVQEVIAEQFGLDVAVVVRTTEQLAKILAWNPFPDAAASRPHLVHVLHLAATPDRERVRDLLAADVAPDQLAARGAEVVVAYAKSSQRSPTEGPLRRLGVATTSRNWRTLTALADLAAKR